jgi:Flp pilus assembly pilin Flp
MMQSSQHAVSLYDSAARVSHDAGKGVMAIIDRLRRFVREDTGQDLVEYALLVALIALFCVGAVTFAGEQIDAAFTAVGNALAASL